MNPARASEPTPMATPLVSRLSYRSTHTGSLRGRDRTAVTRRGKARVIHI